MREIVIFRRQAEQARTFIGSFSPSDFYHSDASAVPSDRRISASQRRAASSSPTCER